MPEESNAYAVVIKDLKRKRDEIDRMIKTLEALVGGGQLPLAADSRVTSSDAVEKERKGHDHTVKHDGDFLGMKIADAAVIVLNRQRKPMSPADITAELERGGLMVSSSNTVASVLNRRGRETGDIVSPRRGYWGLKEWYPGRSFGKKSSDDAAKGDAGTDSSDSSEPEPPGEPPHVVALRALD